MVLIRNENNDYAIKYNISITREGKSVFKKSGQLDGNGGKDTVFQDGIPTSSWTTGSFLVHVEIIHAKLNCLLKTKDFSFTLTDSAGDVKPADGVQTSNKGSVVIRSLYPKIGVGDTFVIVMDNNSSSNLTYEIFANDLKTGALVKKGAGTATAGSPTSSWAVITTAGDHTVQVNMYNPTTKESYTQSFPINVAASNNPNMKVSTTEEPSDPSSPSNKSGSTALNENLDTSKPITHSSNGKVNPSLGEILSGIFEGGDDPTDANLDSVSLLVKKVLEYAFNFAGIVAFIMILWASRMFLNSYGSDESAAMGKKTLLWAFIGLCVIIVAKGILLWIYTTFTT